MYKNETKDKGNILAKNIETSHLSTSRNQIENEVDNNIFKKEVINENKNNKYEKEIKKFDLSTKNPYCSFTKNRIYK